METGLPIEDVMDRIRSGLADPGVVVVTAAPGAGKTTVVPLRLLDEEWMQKGRLLLLEPRRVATRAAARRMADLLGESVGATVGYSTRDDRQVGRNTRIEVVTDGILTRRLQRDPELRGVAGIVFDEFHERRLQSDLGLALALDVRRSIRPDLRIAVMSATIDTGRVAALIGDDQPAPVVTSEGRLHDIEVRWRPTDMPIGRRRGRDLAPPVAAAVREAVAVTPGDVLVFLPGMGEIRAVASAIGRPATSIDVRILHGSSPAADQDEAIGPTAPGRRKIVLSTDVAETSITVEGVTAVVDAGMQRTPAYDPRTGLSRLVTVAASQASATQRAGRAGRLTPGTAIRLWSEAEHLRRAAHTEPEINAVDLSALLLEIRLWGADPGEVALLDPIPVNALSEAYELLVMLGAIDPDSRLTTAGKAMAELPLHPRTAALLLAASGDAGARAAWIAALIEEGDVLRGRPEEVSADIESRLDAIDRRSGSAAVSKARLDRVRRRSREIERRRRSVAPGELESTAELLSVGYPDRVAMRRPGQRGRFVLRNGVGASVGEHDVLGGADFCVVADLDASVGDARIRMAAAMTEAELLDRFGSSIEVSDEVTWDLARGDLVARTQRRLGAIVLSSVEGRPEPGPSTIAALAEALESHGLELLAPSDAARRLQQRLVFLHERVGGDWPDVSDEALVDNAGEWLTVFAGAARGRRDLEKTELAMVLRSRLLPHHHRSMDELAPPSIRLPSGRSRQIEYAAGEEPRVVTRVQDVFGLTSNPTVAGGAVRLLFDLRSPAHRTLQLTSDLAGFWSGSWADVRKEMAGRYPKHAWPKDPTRL